MSAVPMEDLPRRHRITVQEYQRMAEVGLLAPDARVELIDGEIIDMAPIGMSRVGTVMMLDRLLQRAAGDRALILCQGSIVLGGDRYTDESATKTPGTLTLPGLPDASVDLSALFEVSSDS